MLFKDISYLELGQPLCLVDWNHLFNFGRVHLEEQFCEIKAKNVNPDQTEQSNLQLQSTVSLS